MISNVALIYDDQLRPETTGGYCLRALSELVNVEHVRPKDIDGLPRERFDLFLNIDDGMRYVLPSDLRPAAFWAIDTHMDLPWYLEKAAVFDWVFTAQRDGAEQLHEAGITQAQWLPLACDPSIHRRHDVENEYDVAFVGNLVSERRNALLRLIESKFDRTFIGQRYFEEMAETYSASHIVFNQSVKNDVNMRVFEAAACGTLLVTNDLKENGLSDLLKDGVHLATFREEEELLDKLAFYLRHSDSREKVARQGQHEVHLHHTYRHRMEKLLHQVESNSKTQVSVSSDVSQDTQAKDASYFGFARPEILELIPHSAKRLLEIGCASGRLGASVKARQQAEVIGIELNQAAAEEARKSLDRVIIGDIETLQPDWVPQSFDTTICADVLEHLCDPLTTLRRIRDWLTPEGSLIASIPNIRYHRVVSSLLEGNWTYEPSGHLDETHFRFFTRRDMVDLFSDAGFDIIHMGETILESDHEIEHQLSGDLKLGSLAITGLPPGEAHEFFVYQYLIVANVAAAATTHETSHSIEDNRILTGV